MEGGLPGIVGVRVLPLAVVENRIDHEAAQTLPRLMEEWIVRETSKRSVSATYNLAQVSHSLYINLRLSRVS